MIAQKFTSEHSLSGYLKKDGFMAIRRKLGGLDGAGAGVLLCF